MKHHYAIIACLSCFNCAVAADDLFVSVSDAEIQEIADKNFDMYHFIEFFSEPGSLRIAKLNEDAIDNVNGEVTLNLYEGATFSLRNKGISPLHNRSAIGVWTGRLDQSSEVDVLNLSDGNEGKEVTVYIQLFVKQPGQEDYQPAAGMFQVRDQIRALQKQDRTGEAFIGPVDPKSQFRFAIHETDIPVKMPDDRWIIYRIQSLPMNPNYVAISIPDGKKQFDHADGYRSQSEIERRNEIVLEYESFIEERKKEKALRDRNKKGED